MHCYVGNKARNIEPHGKEAYAHTQQTGKSSAAADTRGGGGAVTPMRPVWPYRGVPLLPFGGAAPVVVARGRHTHQEGGVGMGMKERMMRRGVMWFVWDGGRT
eukprot:TRINITY_DN898_c0_g1_i6.p2 TRINITY_DN898_c0_g1~~TRINITY_DN898_c0_g1_i6.p2  ORF type:complete len:103 (-),score=0.06 TRINITY_DN898_c0_g1_i6:82-390(-)